MSSCEGGVVMSSEFERLRESCLKKGELFEDPDFPAVQTSIFYHQKPPFSFVWKRPKVDFSCFLNLRTTSMHSFDNFQSLLFLGDHLFTPILIILMIVMIMMIPLMATIWMTVTIGQTSYT